MPISILNFEWAWQAQFLSHTLETLQTCFFLKDLQMILVPFFEIFDRFWSTKKLASLHLHVNQDLLVLSRDQEKGEFKRFYPTLNRNLNFPASLLRHLKAVTQEKRSLRHCLGSWGGRIENSNYCTAWGKTYSNSDFSWSLDNTWNRCSSLQGQH